MNLTGDEDEEEEDEEKEEQLVHGRCKVDPKSKINLVMSY